MTYSEIIKLEPRIDAVVKRLNPSRSWRRYESAKADIDGLVGFGAAAPELRTSDAYEAVIRVIVDRLNLRPRRR